MIADLTMDYYIVVHDLTFADLEIFRHWNFSTSTFSNLKFSNSMINDLQSL